MSKLAFTVGWNLLFVGENCSGLSKSFIWALIHTNPFSTLIRNYSNKFSSDLISIESFSKSRHNVMYCLEPHKQCSTMKSTSYSSPKLFVPTTLVGKVLPCHHVFGPLSAKLKNERTLTSSNLLWFSLQITTGKKRVNTSTNRGYFSTTLKHTSQKLLNIPGLFHGGRLFHGAWLEMSVKMLLLQASTCGAGLSETPSRTTEGTSRVVG
jgi:hypothetical protein